MIDVIDREPDDISQFNMKVVYQFPKRGAFVFGLDPDDEEELLELDDTELNNVEWKLRTKFFNYLSRRGYNFWDYEPPDYFNFNDEREKLNDIIYFRFELERIKEMKPQARKNYLNSKFGKMTERQQQDYEQRGTYYEDYDWEEEDEDEEEEEDTDTEEEDDDE
jgi:hypothetical protein